jgi:hypothetical protein
MKRNRLISYSIALLLSGLIFGCSTSDRVEDPISINNPDNNISNEISKETQIVEEKNPAVIDPNKNDPFANSASTTYTSDISTNKEVISSEQTALITYSIKDIISGQLANDSVIDKVTLRVDGKYLNFIDQKGNYGTMATLKKTEGTVAIKSLKKSGTTYIELKADIIFHNEDGSTETKQLTSYLPMGIITNGSSTMTIIPNYADDSKKRYDANLGLYIDTFTIHVVDKYGNKAKDGTKVHVGVVNNLKKTPSGEPLYSSVLSGTHISTNLGTLIKTDDNKTKFTTANDLSNVKADDTVVILANEDHSNPLHLGGWGVKDGNTTTLDIWHNYSTDSNTATDGLSFAIGNDKKVNRCEETTATAAIYATEGYEDYKVKDGIVVVELRYDPYMVGKTVFIYANSTLENKRIGVSRRVDLQGTGPQEFYYICDNSDEDNKSAPDKVCPISHILKLKDSHHLIQNANFNSYIQQSGTTCGPIIISPVNTEIGCDGIKSVIISAPAGKKCAITMGDFKPEFE